MTDRDLLSQLLVISQQHPLDPIRVCHHYHLQNKDLPNYIPNTCNHLQTIFYSNNLNSFLRAGQYLAYLLAFEPEYAPAFNAERKEYFTTALQSAEQTLTLAAQLIDQQSNEILTYIKEGINRSSPQNPNQIEFFLRLFEHKLDWQTQKKSLTLKPPHPEFPLLAPRLLTFACEKINNRQEFPLTCKIRLLHKTLQYLSHDLKKDIHQNRILQFAENCMNVTLQHEQTRSHLFSLLTLLLDMFGVFHSDQMGKFVNTHLKYHHNPDFLLLLKTFLAKLNNPTTFPLDYMLNLLTRFYGCLFEKIPLRPQQVYRIKKTICDVIMQISWKNKFDFSKHITALFTKTTHANQDVVLVSLVFLYQQKLASSVSDRFTTPVKTFFNKSQFALYDSLLNFYSSETLQFDEFVNNPNPEQHDFLWSLIALRNTVLIHMPTLLPDCKLYGLLKNLIKFVMLNHFAEECQEIIETIIKEHPEQDTSELQKISLGELFHQLRDHLQGQLLAQETVVRLKKILEMMNAKAELLELKGTRLCLELVIVMHQNCLQRSLPLAYFEHYTALASLAIPKDVSEGSLQEIEEIIPLLADCLQTRPNVFLFNLFLTLLNKTLPLTQLRPSFAAVQNQLTHIIQATPILATLNNSYQIHMYIINGGPFEEAILDNSWKVINDTPNIHTLELPYHVLNLFRHLATDLTGKTLHEFLLPQITRTFQFVNRLTDMLPHKNLMAQIAQIFRLKSHYLLYLYETLKRLPETPCPQLTQIQNHLFTLCLNMKSEQELLPRWEPRLQEIVKQCENTQLLILLIIPRLNLINKTAIRSEEEIKNKIDTINSAKYSLSRTADNKTAIVSYDRLLIAQIQRLKKAQ